MIHSEPIINMPDMDSSEVDSGARVSTYVKTRPCAFHLAGGCVHGHNCSFAHTISELRCPPNLWKTTLCQKFMQGRCVDHTCRYAHGIQELRATDDLYKTAICRLWKVGKCTAGAICRHAHGQKELRQKPSHRSNRVIEPGGNVVEPSMLEYVSVQQQLLLVSTARPTIQIDGEFDFDYYNFINNEASNVPVFNGELSVSELLSSSAPSVEATADADQGESQYFTTRSNSNFSMPDLSFLESPVNKGRHSSTAVSENSVKKANKKEPADSDDFAAALEHLLVSDGSAGEASEAVLSAYAWSAATSS